jgi:serine/threonine-protein kinase
MNAATEDADSADLDGDDVARARLGQVVAGTYRLARHIGSGGSGHVFEAEHLRLGTPFAVKLLRSDLAGRRAAQRFRREAKAAARLRSEHVVRVIDCGELDDHTPYLVMELLEGEDLRRLLDREGPLPARRAVQLVLEACLGLSEVHQHGLVHRDLKPENLFVSRRATGEDWCKVLDFGVAKMDASLSTVQGAIVGTVRYMAPEQLADGASVGPATDVYALGAILHECLSGQKLHGGETIHEVMFSVMNRAPSSLGSSNPSLPRGLVKLVERCLAPEVSARPQQAAELARLLAQALGSEQKPARADVTLMEEAEAPPPQSSSAKRKPRPSIALAALLAAVLGGAVAWLIKPTTVHVPPALSTARRELAPAATAPSTAVKPLASEIAASAAPIAPEKPSTAAVPPAPSSRPPRRSPAITKSSPASAAEKGVSVGAFDAANPYGE